MDQDEKKPQEQEEEGKREAEEELQRLMKQIEEQGGPKPKVIRVKMPKRTLVYVLLETALTFLTNIVLLLSLTGFFEWAIYQTILELIYFILLFTAIELVLKNALHQFFPKWIIKSFGLLLMIPPFIALPLGLFFSKQWVQLHSLGLLIVAFAILLLVRSVFRNILINLPRRK